MVIAAALAKAQAQLVTKGAESARLSRARTFGVAVPVWRRRQLGWCLVGKVV
jgi:hypothetical protein